jgi:hypothetical protein
MNVTITRVANDSEVADLIKALRGLASSAAALLRRPACWPRAQVSGGNTSW